MSSLTGLAWYFVPTPESRPGLSYAAASRLPTGFLIQSAYDLLRVVTQVALTATKTDGYAHFFKEGA